MRPLSGLERMLVYDRQCDLHALKLCDVCMDWQRVRLFGGYGLQPCFHCQRWLRGLRRYGAYEREENA